MQNIIIEVRGGNVVEVYTDAHDLRVTLIDWDEAVDANFNKNNLRYMVKKISDLPFDTKRKFLQSCTLG